MTPRPPGRRAGVTSWCKMDYSKIDEGLYHGARIDRLPAEINAVVNVCFEFTDKLDPNKVRAYAWLPIWDEQKWPGDGWLDMAADVVASFRHAGLNVLVHCAGGVSRSTLVVCGYLIRHRGMTYDQAMEFVTAKRPVANPNDTFKQGLKEYSRKYRGG
jgi:ADP-ribosyl-[dinitrogen reductase] hydrolase